MSSSSSSSSLRPPNLLPVDDSTCDLGNSLIRWRNLYLSGALTNGASSALVGDIIYATNRHREVFYQAEYNASLDNRRVRSVADTGAHRFNFYVPNDFVAATFVGALCIPVNNVVNGDVDLFSDYAAYGEQYNVHTETDTVFTFSGSAGVVSYMDVSSVFSNLAAGDHGGVQIGHNAIGSTINYLGILLRYEILPPIVPSSSSSSSS